MPKWFISILIPALLLNACGGAAPQLSPVEASRDAPPKVVFVTVAPATPTPIPPSPTVTDTATNIPPTETAAPAAPTPEPTPTGMPTAEPTATPEPDWLHSVGRTADNLVYLGNPNAPVTLIDFSDFM